MKFKTIIVSSFALLSLVLGAAAFADDLGSSYYPPERIHCAVKGAKLGCKGFNRRYLVEDGYTADVTGKEEVLAFYSGATYYTLDKSEAKVIFTYRNPQRKTVRLRSASNRIRPVLNKGHWAKIQDDLYVCKGGYMQCPITLRKKA